MTVAEFLAWASSRAQWGGDLTRQVSSSGEIDLTPPGMTVPIAEVLPEIG